MSTYRSYQQVLNIAIQPKIAKSSISKKSTIGVSKKTTSITNNNNHNNNDPNVKRRTKTGCLTCRKRKKKCDEDKVNGKCQGCTRNFLECCWPEATVNVSSSIPKITTITTKILEKCTPLVIRSSSPTLPLLKSTKCSISSLLIQETDVKPEIKVEVPPQQILNPYPSPSQSPLSDAKHEINDISFISLPPLLNVPPYKITNKDSNIRGSGNIKIEESKQDDRVVVAPASPVTSTRSSIVEANTAKFIITSINENKDLCQVPTN
ncbi:hypothetical protein DFJ63DRAFT_318790 [Scheffersomyces coipomensis]|uniref:uncharacterized protein n=1 Tax=Scheffersomyces coipomensis TaxID=1788519 RepID=UPI00315D7FA7